MTKSNIWTIFDVVFHEFVKQKFIKEIDYSNTFVRFSNYLTSMDDAEQRKWQLKLPEGFVEEVHRIYIMQNRAWEDWKQRNGGI